MITNESLNLNLLNVIRRAHISAPIFTPHLEIMYRTGCRASESINRHLWEYSSKDIMILHPLKGNLTRHFYIKDLPQSFLTYLFYENNIGYTVNYNKLSYLFSQLSLYRNIYIGNKASTLHLFRHNHVKLLLKEGYTEIEIKNTLGEKNLKSAMSYINSTFHTQPQDPLIIEMYPVIR